MISMCMEIYCLYCIHEMFCVIPWFWTVTRNFAPSTDISCSSSLNGWNLEQMVHNKIGRHSLEWVDIWNQYLWCSSIDVFCKDDPSWMYQHNHKKNKKRSNKTRIWSTILYCWLRKSIIKHTIIRQYISWERNQFWIR